MYAFLIRALPEHTRLRALEWSMRRAARLPEARASRARGVNHPTSPPQQPANSALAFKHFPICGRGARACPNNKRHSMQCRWARVSAHVYFKATTTHPLRMPKFKHLCTKKTFVYAVAIRTRVRHCCHNLWHGMYTTSVGRNSFAQTSASKYILSLFVQ